VLLQEQNEKLQNENRKLSEGKRLFEEKIRNYETSKINLSQQNDILEIDIKHK
jgi:hypothetical protein